MRRIKATGEVLRTRGVYRVVSFLALCLVLQPCLSGFLFAQAVAPKVQRDWKRDWKLHPAIVEIDTTADVYAVGDPHGDVGRLAELLAAAKIIAAVPERPEQVRWQAGKAVLVCTGDIIDKGDKSLQVIALFQALQAGAAKAGGRVVVTMGNHEASFLTNPTNTKAKAFLQEMQEQKIDPNDVVLRRDERGVGKFLHSLPLAARVNDWFFAHAGQTRGRSLMQLSTELSEGIDARGYDVAQLECLDALLESRMHPTVWWQKEGETPADSKARLAGYAKALGVKHIVIGHQPGKTTFPDAVVRKKGQMFQTYDGLFFMIDVGMSRAVDYSSGALLQITSGPNPRATAIFAKVPAKQLWP